MTSWNGPTELSRKADELGAQSVQDLRQVMQRLGTLRWEATEEETQELVAAALREPTGRSMLDSGGWGGRSWERNQFKDIDYFHREPEGWLDLWGREGHTNFNITLSLFHWLSKNFRYSPRLTHWLRQYAGKTDKWGSGLEDDFIVSLSLESERSNWMEVADRAWLEKEYPDLEVSNIDGSPLRKWVKHYRYGYTIKPTDHSAVTKELLTERLTQLAFDKEFDTLLSVLIAVMRDVRSEIQYADMFLHEHPGILFERGIDLMDALYFKRPADYVAARHIAGYTYDDVFRWAQAAAAAVTGILAYDVEDRGLISMLEHLATVPVDEFMARMNEIKEAEIVFPENGQLDERTAAFRTLTRIYFAPNACEMVLSHLYDDHRQAIQDRTDQNKQANETHLLHQGWESTVCGDNSYNHECLLSQTIQYSTFKIEDVGLFWIIMIHQGADVRGGYGTELVYMVHNDESEGYVPYDEASISCDSCHAYWDMTGGLTEYGDINLEDCTLADADDLEDEDEEEITESAADLNEEAKKYVIVKDEGGYRCPLCHEGYLTVGGRYYS